MACANCVCCTPSSFLVSDLVAHDSLFCCRNDMDNSSALQCPYSICYYVLLHQRYISLVPFAMLCLMHVTLFLTGYVIYSAGWLGNDPLTVVIGESDPYVHISGRVSALNRANFLQGQAACYLIIYLLTRK